MANKLVAYDQLDLPQLEAIIREGLATFIGVGLALSEIKERRLWAKEHPDFNQYCRKVWNFGESNAYYLIQNSAMARALPVPPTTSSHVTPLKQLKTDDARSAAWMEATTLYQEDLTAGRVERIVQKHQFYERGHWLAHPLRDGDITVEHAVALDTRLRALPEYYTTCVRSFKNGWATDPRVLQKLRDIEFEWQDEATDILRSGHLDGVTLPNIQLMDLIAFERALVREKIASRVLAAGAAQAQQLGSQSLIFSGLDVPSVADIDATTVGMVYVFPEDNWTLEQISGWLKNKKVFMVVAATEQEPDINFGDGSYVKPSRVGAVKPHAVVEMIKGLAVPQGGRE